MHKLFCALAFCLFALGGCSSSPQPADANAATVPASAGTVAPAVRNAIAMAVAQMAPRAKVQQIIRTPIAGLYQTIADGQVLYLTGDGRYVIQGEAFDVTTRTRLNALTMDRLRRDAIAKLQPAQMIRYAPAPPPSSRSSSGRGGRAR